MGSSRLATSERPAQWGFKPGPHAPEPDGLTSRQLIRVTYDSVHSLTTPTIPMFIV